MKKVNKPMYTSAEIYKILELEIISLTLKPGQYISEIEISTRFGVSRTPIRDVFKKLEYNNLIRVMPQKGTVVTTINLNRISEFMFAREKVELGLIKEILPIISPYQIAQLEIPLNKQLEVIESGDIESAESAAAFFKSDNEFHRTLFRFANKEDLWELFTTQMPDYQRFRAVIDEFSDRESLQMLYNHHKNIRDCIQAKDYAGLEKIYAMHIYNGMDCVSEIIREKESYFTVV